MLFLLFQLGKDRYALEAGQVVEVVPLLDVKTVPQALQTGGPETGAPPRGVAGMIVYRGRAIPVLDLCEMTTGRPAEERLSTRIIIMETASREPGAGRPPIQSPDPTPDPGPEAGRIRPATGTLPHQLLSAAGCSAPAASRWVGLIAERATELLRRDARDFVAALPAGGQAAAQHLGPVLVDDDGVIQWLQAPAILNETVCQLMNPT